MITIDHHKLIKQALGVELKNLDKDAALCVLINKNQSLEDENKRLKSAIGELTATSKTAS